MLNGESCEWKKGSWKGIRNKSISQIGVIMRVATTSIRNYKNVKVVLGISSSINKILIVPMTSIFITHCKHAKTMIDSVPSGQTLCITLT